MDRLKEFFTEASEIVDSALEKFVPSESEEPRRLHAAMRWSLFGGGKRFRPALVIAVGRHFGAADAALATTAAAIEMIHTYSLIHDDLPAMDDDDLRRGRATSHKKFDEATAILAGDALQALAFRVMAGDDFQLSEKVRLDLLAGLGDATSRMVAGQQMDLEAEGNVLDLAALETIHKNKTGALIRFSAEAGAIIGNASEQDLTTVAEIGTKLGLLFQITDDILDITQPSAILGKTAAKDLDVGKATYPSICGLEGSRRFVSQIRATVYEDIARLAIPAPRLQDIADFLVTRRA